MTIEFGKKHDHDDNRDIPLKVARKMAEGSGYTPEELLEGYATFFEKQTELNRGELPISFADWCKQERGLE